MNVINKIILAFLCASSLATVAAKKGRVGESKLKIGEAGVAWYATMDTAIAEAQRSNRPILFMSAACQAGSVTGTF